MVDLYYFNVSFEQNLIGTIAKAFTMYMSKINPNQCWNLTLLKIQVLVEVSTTCPSGWQPTVAHKVSFIHILL